MRVICKRRNIFYILTVYITVIIILTTTAMVIWKFRDECFHFPIPPSEEHFRKCGNDQLSTKLSRGSRLQLEFQYTRIPISSDDLVKKKLKSLHRDLRTAPQNGNINSSGVNKDNLLQTESLEDSIKHAQESRANVTEYFEYRKTATKEACAKVFYDEDSISFDTENEANFLGELKKLEKLERGENRFFMKTNVDKRTRWIFYKHFDVKNNVEIQWCPIYKAASTPWMAIFTKLSKALTEITEAKIRSGKITFLTLARDFRLFIHKAEIGNIKEQAPRYSMVVVRHPFKRLLSAYRDKIERVKGREYYYRKYSKKIVAHYRAKKVAVADVQSQNRQEGQPMWLQMALDVQKRYPLPKKPTGPEAKEVATTLRPKQRQISKTVPTPTINTIENVMAALKPEPIQVPTFEEFCRYLISVDPKNMDEHWRPQYLDCSPCHHNFDLILKVETLDEDKQAVFKLLGYEDPTTEEYIELEEVWERWTNPSGHAHNESYYFSQLSESLIQDLHHVYELDFELFDYSADKYFEMVSMEK